jgi:hypothetical protein
MIYQGLETAIIIMRIEASKEIENKEGHHRIRNFLKVVPEPIEIQRFKGTGTQKGKGLSIEERAKYSSSSSQTFQYQLIGNASGFSYQEKPALLS